MCDVLMMIEAHLREHLLGAGLTVASVLCLDQKVSSHEFICMLVGLDYSIRLHREHADCGPFGQIVMPRRFYYESPMFFEEILKATAEDCHVDPGLLSL